MRVFETRTATGREYFACQDSGVWYIFILIISDEERYFAMYKWLCKDKSKGKTAHFRLPSASQKRTCLSNDGRRQRERHKFAYLAGKNNRALHALHVQFSLLSISLPS